MGDDFHAVFGDQQLNRRTTPLSGGNAEKHRTNREELHGSQRDRGKGRFQGELSIDDLLSDPSAMNFDRQNAAGPAKHKEHVITDNVEEVERKMWNDAPKQGDYKLEDAWDQAYKDLVRDENNASTSAASSSDKDDEFDVF